MAEESLFPGLEQGLMDAQQHQRYLAAAVQSRRLWMAAGVADEAVQCCDQAVDELNAWLRSSDVLTRRLPFGDNDEGDASAEAFGQAGEKYVEVMQGARDLFVTMAVTYRAAGGLMEQTEQDAAQGLEGGCGSASGCGAPGGAAGGAGGAAGWLWVRGVWGAGVDRAAAAAGG